MIPASMSETPQHFIAEAIQSDLASKKHDSIVTRFPPEPNGYLHVGHAKSICLNFGIAQEFGGVTNLRFDDTNPEKEDQEYIDAIRRDVEWLGFKAAKECYASDYFEQLYAWAQDLIERDLAYVDELNAEQMREYRGTLKQPGKNSPFRDRPAAESLELFAGMRAGQFDEGRYILRAKIDMAHPNINMRDPALYRIRKAHHPRTGDAWNIYPTYDFAHGQSDAIEGITHSLCTLEFEDHRPLYEWFIQNLPVPAQPQQIEFSRLQLEHCLTSKRKLLALVSEGHVRGWDDPRMPTISGMRRRGFTPASIRDFCSRIGVTKKSNTIEMSLLETCLRSDLENTARRGFAVQDPIKLTITNWPKGEVLELNAPWHQRVAELGSRTLQFDGSLYIDAADFEEVPPPKFFRLKPGGSVRLKYAFIIDFQELIKDEQGNIVEILCTYDPATRSGQDESGRKVKGTIQWAPSNAVASELRLYDRLFTDANPTGDNLAEELNPESLVVKQGLVEPALAEVEVGDIVQFERVGFFRKDEDSSTQPVFNRAVTLKDGWAKVQKKGG